MAYASASRAVEIIGHRGSPREHRENTLPSFQLAFEAGANGIELDVHGTADGEVVVHHDASTNSRPGDKGPVALIAESTAESLRASATSVDTMIPTLREVLNAAPKRAVVYVEIKARAIEESVISVIRASGRQAAVHSFDHRISKRVAELAPEIPVGILQTSYPVDPLRPLREAHARDLWQHWELLDRELIAGVHENGGRVIAWTVNDRDLARQLVAWGIDGICTDLPGAMRSLVGELAR
jgi:glycerophosphoryl diester phosphodiesterase